MSAGGTYAFRDFAITMIHAIHSPSVTEGDQIIYAGEPARFVIRFENGFTLFHAGDTGVFGDMRMIDELYKLDHPFRFIGDRFIMEAREAAHAAKLLGLKYVISSALWDVPSGEANPGGAPEVDEGCATDQRVDDQAW